MRFSDLILFIKEYVLKRDLIILNLFIILHILAYSTAVLFGTTLEIPRALLAVLAIGVLYSPAKILQAKILLYYLLIVILSVAFSEFLGSHIFSTASVLLYLIVFYGFANYFRAKGWDPEKLVYILVFWYSMYFIASLLIANTFRLDYYADEDLELFGFKSRMVGWSGAIFFAFLISVLGKIRRKELVLILMAVCVVSIIGSGSRSALISISLVLIYAISRFEGIKMPLRVVLALLIVSGVIYFNSKGIYEESSFNRRAELVDKGVSYNTYRTDIWMNYLSDTWSNLPESLLPHGDGPDNFFYYKQTSLKMTDNLSSHSTILHLLIAFGVLSLPVIFKIYHQSIKEIFNLGLLVFIPIVIISLTEDSFGGGQFLFPFIIYLYAK